MILLAYGEDSYRKDARLNEIIESGKELYGSINIRYYDEKISFAELSNEIYAIPFLSKKRLLIGKDILASKNSDLLEKISQILKDIPETTDMVFKESEPPDQRKTLFKSLKQHGKVENFEPLKPYETIKWIKDKVKKYSGSIEDSAAQTLFQYCSNDLFRLENEITKLLNYDMNIKKEAVQELVKPEYSDSIFELMDAISEKKAETAIKILNRFFENNENEQYIVAMLARQIKNLLIIKNLKENNATEAEILKSTKLHPFVVKKTLQQSRNFTVEELKELHKRLFEVDIKLKSDNIDSKIILTNFVFAIMKK